tara:strand:+ start:333 stop:509 length:177 start_codon:yes stop_codon:yes gene_type:complete
MNRKATILLLSAFLITGCGDLTGWYGCSKCLKDMPEVHNKGYTKEPTTDGYLDVPLTE